MMRKGANMERELVKMFKEIGWGAIRISGSGKMDKAPDIIAGRPRQLLIIECKSSKKEVIYIKSEEILNVISYAAKFGGEPWYGIRFNNTPWRFIPAQELLSNTKVTRGQGIDFEMLTLKDRKTI